MSELLALTDQEIEDLKRSLVFDMERVGVPGSTIRRNAKFVLQLIAAYQMRGQMFNSEVDEEPFGFCVKCQRQAEDVEYALDAVDSSAWFRAKCHGQEQKFCISASEILHAPSTKIKGVTFFEGEKADQYTIKWDLLVPPLAPPGLIP